MNLPEFKELWTYAVKDKEKQRCVGGKTVLICLLLLGAGCVRMGQQDSSGSGAVVSRIVSMHSEVFGRSSGSVALRPQFFHDPMVLWRTPDAKSGQDSEAISVVFAPESFMERWLPHGERDTMHRFMRTLGDERGPPPFILNRIRRDLPMIQEVFRDYGLPPELAFLPAVESSFRPWAMSPAGAAGLWQLMPGTAQRFGLTISENEDQRFDKRQSTVAAAAYLAELYRLFCDWPLALAAYNCGEGALARALVRTGAVSLSDLTAACRGDRKFSGLLPGETLDYVPRFVGAVKVLSALIGLDGMAGPAGSQAAESDLEKHPLVSPPVAAAGHGCVAKSTVDIGQGVGTP